MINKISYSPSFKSDVRVVYDNNFGLRDFYSSRTAKRQLDKIKNNGIDDERVTLLPIRGNRTTPSVMKVQVMKNYMGINCYNSEIAYEPKDIYCAYSKASNFSFSKNKKTNPKPVRDNVVLMDYIV